MAAAVPAYGHLPPSSLSCPTVSVQPGTSLAANTGAMQHKLGTRGKLGVGWLVGRTGLSCFYQVLHHF